jgi:hypothetical protein
LIPWKPGEHLSTYHWTFVAEVLATGGGAIAACAIVLTHSKIPTAKALFDAARFNNVIFVSPAGGAERARRFRIGKH